MWVLFINGHNARRLMDELQLVYHWNGANFEIVFKNRGVARKIQETLRGKGLSVTIDKKFLFGGAHHA